MGKTRRSRHAFEVFTARDADFVAASFLVEGRLAADLRDTGVAYSLLTRESLVTLEITNLVEAAVH